MSGKLANIETIVQTLFNALYGNITFKDKLISKISEGFSNNKIYTVVVTNNKIKLVDLPKLPLDPNPYTEETCFYFYYIVIINDVCYEGYVYWTNLKKYMTLVKVYIEEAFHQRVSQLE